MQEALPVLINNTLKAYNTWRKLPIEDVDVTVEFGEYASPAFSDVVDVISKARANGIMSVERCVKELYGDTITENDFIEEVNRIKEEQGIIEFDEPSINKEME